MALEDRCSPQSAPSPPGLPHSPPKQTTTTTTTTTTTIFTKTNTSENINNNNNNTTIALKDMSLQQTVTADTSPVAATMLPHSVAASLYQQQQLQHLHQLQQLQQLHQQQLAAAAAANCVFPSQPGYEIAVSQAVALQQRLSLSPGAHSTSSTPASSLTIKEEENDSIMGDGCSGDHCMHTDLTTKTTPTTTIKETSTLLQCRNSNQQQHITEDEDDEDDIDVDDVDVEERQQQQQQQQEVQQQEHNHYLPPPAHQQSHKPTLAFSISNILSDRFGGCEQQQQQQHQTQILADVNGKGVNNKQQEQQQQRVTAPANNTIFRPFDQARAATATPSAFTRVDLLEFSRQQQAAAAAATAAMMLERANILNCFNPVAYPRIHEEILQSRMRRTGILPHSNNNGGTHSRQQVLLNKSNDGLEKSALGSLCKTVSQIGKNSTSSSSSSSSSSCSNSLQSSVSLPSSINDNKSNSSSSQGSTNSINASPSSSVNSMNNVSSRLISSKSISPQPIPPPSAISRDSGMESSDDTRSETGSTTNSETGKNEMWPAWVFCTRYSDRPSSGPRYRRPKQPKDKNSEEKRPRTAFSSEQLARLKREFNENRYLTERRRQQLSSELGLNEAQIKIWFQNKRAKIKKSTGTKNPLALQLMAQGLYNHTTVPLTKEEEELEMRMNGQIP